MARWLRLSEIPSERIACVYAVFEGETLVYIGMSHDVRKRLLVHVRRFKVTHMKISPEPTLERRRERETSLLSRLRPIGNTRIPFAMNRRCRVRSLRWAAGFSTIAQLARMTKIEYGTLWNIEKGFRRATEIERKRLARVLKVAPEALGL